MSAHQEASSDLGRLTLRVSVAGMLLLHGIAKLQHGVAGMQGMLHARGIPGFVSYGVLLGEVVAPLLMAIGLWTRPSALVVVVNMVVAVGLVHGHELFSRGAQGGWAIELPMLYAFGALAVMLLGAGRYSVSGGKGRLD